MGKGTRVATAHARGLHARPARFEPKRFALAFVLAILLAIPVAAVIRLAPESLIGRMRCLALVPGHEIEVGYALAALAFAVVLPLAYAAFGALPRWVRALDDAKVPHLLDFTFDRRGIARATGLIVVCWLPVFVIMAPCATTTYDTAIQLYQFFTPAPTYYDMVGRVVEAEFIDHHPVLDTLIMGGFVALGDAVGGGYWLGFLLYGIVQGLLCALVLAASVCYTERLGLPAPVRIALLAFVAIFPIFSASADTMQKDTLFSLALLAWALFYMETCRSEGAALKSWRFVIAFVVLGCLVILTKKTGAIIVVACLAVMFVAVRGCRVRVLVALVLPVALSLFAFPAIVYPALSVAPGGSQEIYGMLYQQVIAAEKADPNALSEADIAVVDRVIDYEAAMKTYMQHKTDYVKQHQRADMTSGDLMAFLGVWAKCGLAHPDVYVKAHLMCCGAMIVPTAPYTLATNVSQKGFWRAGLLAEGTGHEFQLDVRSWEAGQEALRALNRFYQNAIAVVPPFSLLATMGFWGSWVPLILLALALRFDKRSVLMLLPLLISALLLLACPANVSRYVLANLFLFVPAMGMIAYAVRR